MPTILTIGYRKFLVRRDQDAAAAIRALAGAIPVESRFKNGQTYYWPEQHREQEISMTTVLPRQLIECDPADVNLEVEQVPPLAIARRGR